MKGGHSLRYFSGDNGDPREYRRWKQWVQSKIMTMDKLPKAAHGAFIFTLLQGKAMEVVEHLKESEYQKEGGDKVPLDLLDKCWPQKDGESVRDWSTRAREVFDRCYRKTDVSFPEEAKGWITLHRSGLSEEQRAVVLSRCSGSLKYDDVAQAMRSCYPEYTVSKRRTAAAHYVEEEDGESWYQDDYGFSRVLEGQQKARKFSQANDVKRSFMVEVEELKKKTQCHRCGCTGHWARECRMPRNSAAPGAGASSSAAATSGAGLVQQLPDFVCVVTAEPEKPSLRSTMVQQLRARLAQTDIALHLISSPGYAVLDSGLWTQRAAGLGPAEHKEQNSFRFGNGSLVVSNKVIEMPISIAGKHGVIRAAITRGQGPLLLSRPGLKRLQARLDFDKDELVLFDEGIRAPLRVNEAGQYVVPVLGQRAAEDEEHLKLIPGENNVEPTDKENSLTADRITGWDFRPAVTSATASLYEESLARQIAVRQAARKVRPSTAEEQVLVDTPGLDLIGIKQLLERAANNADCACATIGARDDFAEMMQEVVPRLVTQALQQPGVGSADIAGESAESQTGSRGTKREASSEPPGPSGKRAAAESSATASESNVDEALLCEWQQSCGPVEALAAAHINKCASKEIPASNNPQEFQMEVRRHCPDRIMGSRFVCTWNEEEDQPGRVKSRWCLQGHLDPDLSTKALAGDLQSPTLSQLGRALLFQVIASKKWTVMLGDVKGAFLASGQLPEKYRPLFARLPAGGIPGVPEDALIEVLGRVYGLNDSPSTWSKTLNHALLDVGFERSRLDPCLYFMREAGKLTGIVGVHVDDNATGGKADKYHRALELLKKRCEFRKWRLGNGDFCGANYNQDASSGEITMTQETFVGKLSPLRFSRARTQDKTSELTPDEVRCFRAINGSLNWLSTQPRPDLSTQVSFAQQSFPTPRVADAVAVNQAVRRAKQHAAMPIVYRSVPIEELTIMMHSDAAYAKYVGCRDLLETSMDEDPFDGASDDWSHLSADDFGTFSEMMSSPSPVEEPPQPRAKSGNQKPSSNKVPEDTELPPNVADLNQWGRTLIQFGKYKTAGMTHEELALADTKEMNSCKVWVVAHLRSDDRTVPRLGTLPSRLHRCRHDQEACGDPLRELRAPIRPSQEFVIQLPPWWTFDSQKAVNSSAHAHHSSPPFVMLMFFFLRYQCDRAKVFRPQAHSWPRMEKNASGEA
ncbi:putative transposon protein [Symbiodinium microadriaticum]|uniref:Putative transposon protein n=1 Tax=Symbiodinium microadriaticum TaxID=2951 RepID=A0A1Q9CT92_SYMMI|nr:putative transposon protein [Symbiodinium microadriaticum]CAE7909111.1 TY5A [Symbiodinium microadriaticum]